MSVQGGVGINNDGSANARVGIEGGKDPHRVAGAVFADGIRRSGAQTVGASIDYQHSDKMRAGASVAAMPKSGHKEVSLHSSVNLHKTDNSCVKLDANASRQTGPHTSGKWNKGVNLNFRKEF